jgi:hypothetical protein
MRAGSSGCVMHSPAITWAMPAVCSRANLPEIDVVHDLADGTERGVVEADSVQHDFEGASVALRMPASGPSPTARSREHAQAARRFELTTLGRMVRPGSYLL